MIRLFIILLLLITGLYSFAQPPEQIDFDYYSPPMKIPFFLSGNFGELRSNHFHTGIDIKTQGRTGLSVYSAAEGTISRISVSPAGYGNALYIDHPNGTTTVYGHLESFAPHIQEHVRRIQYEKESFAIDQSVPAGILKVNKGELIAKSGNAGSSAGPHLHFEIRKTKNQISLNSLLFHVPVKDRTKPVIQSLWIYPLSEEAGVYGKQQAQRFETILNGKDYLLKNNQAVQVWDKIGFGLQANDILDGAPNKCGIYSLKLFVDNELIYSFAMNHLMFDESRYLNSHTDYEQFIRSGRHIYRTWIEPGNKLSVYGNVEKRGIYKATDGQSHQIRYEITDSYGNTTSLAFKIQSKKTTFSALEPKGEQFRYNRNNHIREEDIEFNIPEGALYNDVDFRFSKKPGNPKFYSSVYSLHNAYVPLHFSCNLRIKADNLPSHLESKVMLAQVDPVSGKIYSATGKFVNGWVEGNIRVLGNYALTVDTVAPKIVSLSIKDKKTLTETNKLRFTITDNLSGIETYKGTIDGHWVLFEYDLKNNLISYTFDKERLHLGSNHVLILTVSDYKGNTSTYKANFFK